MDVSTGNATAPNRFLLCGPDDDGPNFGLASNPISAKKSSVDGGIGFRTTFRVFVVVPLLLFLWGIIPADRCDGNGLVTVLLYKGLFMPAFLTVKPFFSVRGEILFSKLVPPNCGELPVRCLGLLSDDERLFLPCGQSHSGSSSSGAVLLQFRCYMEWGIFV